MRPRYRSGPRGIRPVQQFPVMNKQAIDESQLSVQPRSLDFRPSGSVLFVRCRPFTPELAQGLLRLRPAEATPELL
jgi:hypothetical protein